MKKPGDHPATFRFSLTEGAVRCSDPASTAPAKEYSEDRGLGSQTVTYSVGEMKQAPTPSLPEAAPPPEKRTKRLKGELGLKHKALAQWLIAHPTATNRQAAEAFGMSTAWISAITHSDAFRHYLAELEETIDAEVLVPLRARIHSVAENALTKLDEKIRWSEDPKFLLEVADKTLHRLGYAPTRGPEIAQGPVAVQQNVYMVEADTLKEARSRMQNGALPPPSGNVLEHKE